MFSHHAAGVKDLGLMDAGREQKTQGVWVEVGYRDSPQISVPAFVNPRWKRRECTM